MSKLKYSSILLLKAHHLKLSYLDMVGVTCPQMHLKDNKTFKIHLQFQLQSVLLS